MMLRVDADDVDPPAERERVLRPYDDTHDEANQRLVLLSVADGTVRILKELSHSVGLASAAISPDGRYILYDYPQSESSLAHDIFLLPIAGGKETPLVEHPADDLMLGWAPDRKVGPVRQ